MKRCCWLVVVIVCALGCERPSMVVGSKAFAESSILAEAVTQYALHEQISVEHRRGGPTPVMWKALLAGEIDLYPEYTGTITKEILDDVKIEDSAELRAALAERGVVMSPPLGFTNPYAIGMRAAKAEELGIRTLSDLQQHPTLKFAFSTEFLRRSDGWPGLQQCYRLPQQKVAVMEHGLAYKSVSGGEADATDVYLTDASIQRYDLRVLEDDLHYFPPYEGVLLYRSDLTERVPGVQKIVDQLAGAISTSEMQALNALVQIDRQRPSAAAAELLANEFELPPLVQSESFIGRLLRLSGEHLFLALTALIAGILVAVPLGVLAAKRKRLEHLILSTAEVLQTIPGLAMLVLLMPMVREIGLRGTGPAPVIIALFLYSLLPIIRNTFTGMRDIPHTLRESAEVLGLTPWAILWQVELPMASRMILAGIKTTAVMTVGFATLGGLIGAGGFGQPISEGLGLDDVWLMMEGAIPAAVLAIGVKFLFEIAERYVVPKGLRL